MGENWKIQQQFPACGPGVSPRTVRWGGTLLPQSGNRAGDGMARFVSEEKATGTQAFDAAYFRRRLSLRVAQKVPALWNTCTMSTSRMTHTIMMSVW